MRSPILSFLDRRTPTVAPQTLCGKARKRLIATAEVAGSRPRVRGRPGEWEYEDAYDDDSVREQDPLWLLELIAATTGAAEAGAEGVLGVPCISYRTCASLKIAMSHSHRPMREPTRARATDLERFTVDVWLDHTGRLRQAILRGHGRRMMLELSDFGGPPGIDLPSPDEIHVAR